MPISSFAVCSLLRLSVLLAMHLETDHFPEHTGGPGKRLNSELLKKADGLRSHSTTNDYLSSQTLDKRGHLARFTMISIEGAL